LLRPRKAGAHGKRAKVRVVPMSPRVWTLLEHHFALEKAFPVKVGRAQGIVRAVADRAGITRDVSPHILRHTFATTALQKGISLPTVQKILGRDRPVGCPGNWTTYARFLRRCYSTPKHAGPAVLEQAWALRQLSRKRPDTVGEFPRGRQPGIL
jgi:integrase/recombinase XerD